MPGEGADRHPEQGNESIEVKNTQYPEFKKWLPPALLKRDITFRNMAMVIADPFGGPDIVVEFVSYNQKTQAMAGVQRCSIWEDEEPPKDFHDEQLPRLLAENGDLILTLTPANVISWTYDEIFEKAQVYYRTEAVAKFADIPRIETTNSGISLAVIQAATDDNPTLSLEVIESMFMHYDDPDTIAIRRYGIFKQISGRIFKGYEPMTHMISREKYALDVIPHDWVHGRFVDYHEHTPWAVVWLAISPEDEVFVYDEYNPSPERFVTREITQTIASMSGDYRYRINLIDPLGAKTQSNTGKSVMDDFNQLFYQYKREGLGTGGFWESWDTKSTRGRDEIRKRLKNAKQCQKPFNNKVEINGRTEFLPTIWILSHCKTVGKSLRMWRWEEWANNASKITKEQKEVAQQKFSHFPTAIEAAFKDSRFRKPSGFSGVTQAAPMYFQARR